MKRSRRALTLVGAAVLAACSSAPQKDTLATLHKVSPDLQDVKVEGGLDTAMQSYQRFLAETPETQRTPEAMRRLADLKIEKEYGLNGTGELIVLGRGSRTPTSGSRVRVTGRVSDVAVFGGRSIGLHMEERDLEVRRR